MFDITCFPTFVGASDALSRDLFIRKLKCVLYLQTADYVLFKFYNSIV